MNHRIWRCVSLESRQWRSVIAQTIQPCRTTYSLQHLLSVRTACPVSEHTVGTSSVSNTRELDSCMPAVLSVLVSPTVSYVND
jgi:hypothetical protein